MVINNQPVTRGITFEQYVALFGVGEILSRSDVAKRKGVSYSNAAYHLERAVAHGMLHKQHGYASDNQPGWVYGLPQTMPSLEGV